ncbi:hypothetical protein SMIDD22_01645 [Streptococcus mitis]|uniref:Uncharacterized protein n=1 Tax=Streptococcus mitis TaxID=28037 RepID=A0A139R8U6_STRMT|nr:hypothetical protein SMIDD22_01645 [Streptococcus mitis]
MKVTRKHLCRDFLGTDTQFVADVLLYEWWDVGKVPNRTRNLTSFHTSSRMLETLDVALHFAVPSGQFKTKGCRLSVNTMGTPHHDGELVLLSLISDDTGEVFKVTTDDIVGLLIEVTVGRVHHVSRSQAIVNPLTLFTQRLRNRTRESHHIVTRLLLDFQNTVDVKVRFFANQSYIFLRNFPQLSPCLVSQDFHLKPSTVFIFFTPNVRHLRARVTVDHDVSP